MISPTKSNASSSNKKTFENKLFDIEEKIRNVRLQINEISPGKKTHHKLPKIETKFSKKQLFHPNLDLVMAEMAYSPYHFGPDQKYTPKTFMSGKVAELRFEKKEVALSKIPYDLKEAKNRFIEEVIKFNPSFVSK